MSDKQIVSPITIDYEDDEELQHAEGGSFCSDPTCPCHEDPDLIAELYQDVQNGLLSPEEATAIVNGNY